MRTPENRIKRIGKSLLKKNNNRQVRATLPAPLLISSYNQLLSGILLGSNLKTYSCSWRNKESKEKFDTSNNDRFSQNCRVVKNTAVKSTSSILSEGTLG